MFIDVIFFLSTYHGMERVKAGPAAGSDPVRAEAEVPEARTCDFLAQGAGGGWPSPQLSRKDTCHLSGGSKLGSATLQLP